MFETPASKVWVENIRNLFPLATCESNENNINEIDSQTKNIHVNANNKSALNDISDVIKVVIAK